MRMVLRTITYVYMYIHRFVKYACCSNVIVPNDDISQQAQDKLGLAIYTGNRGILMSDITPSAGDINTVEVSSDTIENPTGSWPPERVHS